MTSQVERLGNLIGDASRVVVLTGAGISTASGIPDFRGPDGVWRTLRPITFDRFVRDPRARREYWHQKVLAEPLVAAAEPNAVHHACTRLEHDGRLDTVITQNVDGLHTAAGTSRSSLVEIHGNAREAVCLSCDRRTPVMPHLEAFSDGGEPPVCDCGGLIKPAAISFGQPLDVVDLERATAAVDRCDLLIALGSTLVVYPVADLPLRAIGRMVPYVIVNRGETDHDSLAGLTLRIHDDVTEVFPAAVDLALA